jgi:hypothetical protein
VRTLSWLIQPSSPIRLHTPAVGKVITYDTEVKGFGCRVYPSGARTFVLNYRTRGGRERRITIGSFPDWNTAAARKEAAELKKAIDRGAIRLVKSRHIAARRRSMICATGS